MDLNELMKQLTENGGNLGWFGIAVVAVIAAVSNWPKIKAYVTGKGEKETEEMNDRSEAFEASNTLVAFYTKYPCPEGLKAAREAGEAIFHIHLTPPTPPPATPPSH